MNEFDIVTVIHRPINQVFAATENLKALLEAEGT
jgi:hypothetical protein